MHSKGFQKKKEDFFCENCNTHIVGDGYTDHCPKCLYSKHVDVNPGDRMSDCKALMEPIAAEVLRDGFRIHYVCQKCGYKHRVMSSSNDDLDFISVLVQNSF